MFSCLYVFCCWLAWFLCMSHLLAAIIGKRFARTWTAHGQTAWLVTGQRIPPPTDARCVRCARPHSNTLCTHEHTVKEQRLSSQAGCDSGGSDAIESIPSYHSTANRTESTENDNCDRIERKPANISRLIIAASWWHIAMMLMVWCRCRGEHFIVVVADFLHSEAGLVHWAGFSDDFFSYLVCWAMPNGGNEHTVAGSVLSKCKLSVFIVHQQRIEIRTTCASLLLCLCAYLDPFFVVLWM